MDSLIKVYDKYDSFKMFENILFNQISKVNWEVYPSKGDYILLQNIESKFSFKKINEIIQDNILVLDD